jgi:hypothetical protein
MMKAGLESNLLRKEKTGTNTIKHFLKEKGLGSPLHGSEGNL